MFMRLRARPDGSSEGGFTVIELLVVIIIVGVLLAIAVPSYLGFRDRAANNSAKANLRGALPAAEAYYEDNSTFAGMKASHLTEIDSGVSPTLKVTAAAASSFCLTDTVNGKTWSVLGPSPSSGDFMNNATCA